MAYSEPKDEVREVLVVAIATLFAIEGVCVG